MDITTGGPVHEELAQAFTEHKKHSRKRRGPAFHERSLEQMKNDGCMPADLHRKYLENARQYSEDIRLFDRWAGSNSISLPGQSELWGEDEYAGDILET